MPTVTSIMADLKRKGSEKTRKTYARHGMDTKRMFGVSVADEGLLSNVVKGIGGAPNRVRYTMNGFVIAVGTYVKPLLKRAKESARLIGAVAVDMGDTACNIPLATAYIEKSEASGRVGQKRKTIRC